MSGIASRERALPKKVKVTMEMYHIEIAGQILPVSI